MADREKAVILPPFCALRLEQVAAKTGQTDVHIWFGEVALAAVIKNIISIMYAIVNMLGQQFKVEAGKKLFIHRMDTEKGAKVEFDEVLLVDNDGNVTVGTPTVKGAKVVCEVLDNECRGEKILVFHKKRRKGYRKLNGHRQDLTNVVVKEIVVA